MDQEEEQNVSDHANLKPHTSNNKRKRGATDEPETQRPRKKGPAFKLEPESDGEDHRLQSQRRPAESDDNSQESQRKGRQGEVALEIVSHADKQNTSLKDTATPKADENAKTVYTETFFNDMANRMAETFPYETFAKYHDCTTTDVSHAFTEVVGRPLVGLARCLRDNAQNLSIADYGKKMVEYCKEYMAKLNSSTAPLLHGPSTMSFGSGNESAISNMEAMGFARSDIDRALGAAQFNSDLAIEYLLTVRITHWYSYCFS